MKAWFCWKRVLESALLVSAIALTASASPNLKAQAGNGSGDRIGLEPTPEASPEVSPEFSVDPPINPGPDPSQIPTLAELEAALSQRRWDRADELTLRILSQGYPLPDTRRFRQFPCNTLAEMDRLWRQASGDRYGFGVQRRIWASIGNRVNNRNETAQQFKRQVGWHVEQTGPIDSRPVGYFPTEQFWANGRTLAFGCGDAECTIPRTVVDETEAALDHIFPRLTQCRVR
ncbi:MAG: GUN4 domain-containing protein [Cyanobacteria bacterium]|nr:GUN4 domain-containing protein [Cyanobacteriota bacterium]